MKIFFYTTLALIAFAGNSVLCRLALADGAIDAAGFTAIRLLSGIVVLAIILQLGKLKSNGTDASKGSWKASMMLFIYAGAFSYAYISLETGIGALVLFGVVQFTMILSELLLGKKLHQLEWLGLVVAFCGFLYLVLPSLRAPLSESSSFSGFVLMTIAGVAWGFYTLFGRGSENPLSDTAYNFFRTLPFVIILIGLTFQHVTLSSSGIVLAVLSGGLASGVGYTIWYMALPGLSTTQAAVVQLLVPVIAAIGGVIFAREIFSVRLLISSVMILGGILAVVMGRHFATKHVGYAG